MTTSSNPNASEPAVGAHRAAPPANPAPVDAAHREGVALAVATRRQDLVSWSAIWAGLVVAISLFLLLELIFFSLGWLEFGEGGTGTTAGVITAILALIAFLVGGIAAGATSVWREGNGGLFHGIALWALGMVAIVFLTLFGGGALFGSVANVMTQAATLQQASGMPEVQMQEALETARTGAAWAVLAMLLPLLAAAVGGVIGSKLGSKASDATTDHVR